MFFGEAFDAVAGRHVAEARAPERQRVDDRLAQDQFSAFASGKTLIVDASAAGFHHPRRGPGR